MIHECHFLDTGYCLASEHHVLQGGRRKRIQCHSLAGLLRHPDQGWILWDTGYAPRVLEATRPWPFWLYRLATPLHVTPGLAAAHQLSRFGLKPDNIRLIILSHFHADHLAGLRDFPRAQIVVQRIAYQDVASRTGFNALRRAFIPALLPDDFAERAVFINDFSGPPLPALGRTHDLFGDGLILLVDLPGHARGQMGMLADAALGRILFAADGAWFRQSIRERRPPAPITSLIADDPRAVRETIVRLHEFSQACPEVIIAPTHCPEVYEKFCR